MLKAAETASSIKSTIIGYLIPILKNVHISNNIQVYLYILVYIYNICVCVYYILCAIYYMFIICVYYTYKYVTKSVEERP